MKAPGIFSNFFIAHFFKKCLALFARVSPFSPPLTAALTLSPLKKSGTIIYTITFTQTRTSTTGGKSVPSFNDYTPQTLTLTTVLEVSLARSLSPGVVTGSCRLVFLHSSALLSLLLSAVLSHANFLSPALFRTRRD